jgi:hypothetical protein
MNDYFELNKQSIFYLQDIDKTFNLLSLYKSWPTDIIMYDIW